MELTQVNYKSRDEVLSQSSKDLQKESNQELKPSCRICLSSGVQNTDQNNSMVSPCNCRGSLEFVHENCMGEWIKRKCSSESFELKRKKIKCQVCQKYIHFDFQFGTKFNSWAKIKQKITKEPFKSIILFVLLLVFLGFSIFMIVIVSKNESQNQIFLILMTILSFLLLFIYIIFFLKVFFLKKTLTYIKIHNRNIKQH